MAETLDFQLIFGDAEIQNFKEGECKSFCSPPKLVLSEQPGTPHFQKQNEFRKFASNFTQSENCIFAVWRQALSSPHNLPDIGSAIAYQVLAGLDHGFESIRMNIVTSAL